MAYIITSRTQLRATDKPPPGSMVDWQHPLARGLVGCYLFNRTPLEEYSHSKSDVSSMAANPWNQYGFYSASAGTTSKALSDSRTVLKMTGAQSSICSGIVGALAISSAGLVDRWVGRNSAGGLVNERSFATVITAAGEVGCYVSSDGTTNVNYLATIAAGLGAGSKFTVAGVYIPSVRITAYVNELSTDATSSPAAAHDSTYPWYVGTQFNQVGYAGSGANNGNFVGTMYYAYIYNRALLVDEIQHLRFDPYQFIWHPKRRSFFVPTAAPQNFAPDCATATGQAYDPSIVASGDAPFAVDAATGTGQAYDATIVATGDAVFAPDTATGTGQAYDPVIVASGDAIFAPDTATGTGSAYDPGIVASGDAVFAPDTATGTGASYDPALAFVFAPATATGTGAAYIPGVTATGEAPVDPDTPTGDGTANDPSITNIPTPPPPPSAAATTCVGRSSGTDSIRCYGSSTNADGCQTKGRRGSSNSLRSYGVSSS